MQIEYENGLPKGYMERRKKTGIIYACSVYLFIAFNLLVKFEVFRLTERVRLITFWFLLIISIVCLCRSILARLHFKGLFMYNHDQFNAFTGLEKLLYTLPAVLSIYFIPLNIFTYLCIAVPAYLAVKRMPDPNEKYDYRNSHMR